MSESSAAGFAAQPKPDPDSPIRQSMRELLARTFGRPPGPRQIDAWIERLQQFPDPQRFVTALIGSEPAKEFKPVSVHNEPGHFFSPVVDPSLVRDYVDESRKLGQGAGLAGVRFPAEQMEAFWARNRAIISATPLSDSPDSGRRYHFTGEFYPYGDGATLRAMIADRRPKRIVEIGSGDLTACMLDAIDEFRLDTRITCIDSAPESLRELMRPGDEKRVEIIPDATQGQRLDLFANLGPTDILFINTSHVLKTGSDVHYALFYILPVLRPGVAIHIHDCRSTFEYSDDQIFDRNTSWNEAYAVRALLMYSSRFRVLFSGSWFAACRREMVETTFAPFLRNPGAALWLEVVDDGRPYGLQAVGGMNGFKGGPVAPAAGEPAPVPQKPAQVQAAPGLTPQPPVAPAKPLQDPEPPAAPEAPKAILTEVSAAGVTAGFNIVHGGAGRAFFSLGVRKSGSTLLHKIVSSLAIENRVNIVNLPDTFFRKGVLVKDWVNLDQEPLLKPANVYIGYRAYVPSMIKSPTYVDGLKIFMPRDPRDALVSQYFSDAYSHSLPADNKTGSRDAFLKKRSDALNTDIDTWVLEQAPHLGRTLTEYEPVLDDKRCLVVPYETFVFEKVALLQAITGHFEWALPQATIDKILAELDIRPDQEDPNRFVRKAVPGDHRVKLRPETIEALGDILAKPLRLFGYR